MPGWSCHHGRVWVQAILRIDHAQTQTRARRRIAAGLAELRAGGVSRDCARTLQAAGIQERIDDLFCSRDLPGGMYGLVRGILALSIAPGERGPYIAHFARPGTWFGEAAAFTEQPRRIGLAVTRDTAVLHLPLPAVREIVTVDPGAWRFFGLAAIAHYDVAIGAADDLLIRDHVKRSVAVALPPLERRSLLAVRTIAGVPRPCCRRDENERPLPRGPGPSILQPGCAAPLPPWITSPAMATRSSAQAASPVTTRSKSSSTSIGSVRRDSPQRLLFARAVEGQSRVLRPSSNGVFPHDRR